jgi:death-on-curing family protein
MEYVDVEDLIRFNKKLNSMVKKGYRLLSKEKLLDAVNEIKQAKDVEEGIAKYLYRINQEHAFLGANKRTAYMAADVFAQLNGYDFELDKEQAVELGKKIREHEISYPEVLRIVKQKSKRFAMA